MSQEYQVRIKEFDSREPESIRMKLLEYGWNQKKLHTGDYWFFAHDFKKVGIERKTIQDLISSIGDRLSRQLETMLDHYNVNILILEGSWKTVSPQMSILSTRGIEHYTWSTVWNYLERFQQKGISIQLTVNEGHTIRRVNELYALYQKSYSLSSRSSEYADDRIMAFPSGSRGKTAMECIKYFGSLNKVATAEVEALTLVPGVGDKKAQSIWNHFNKGT